MITKPDRIPRGDEESWIRYIKNEDRPLANGWFSVKQPDPQALKDGITWEGARAAERDWFANTAPWSSLDFECQQHLGTGNLTSSLSDLLSGLVAKRYVLLTIPRVQSPADATLCPPACQSSTTRCRSS